MRLAQAEAAARAVGLRARPAAARSCRSPAEPAGSSAAGASGAAGIRAAPAARTAGRGGAAGATSTGGRGGGAGGATAGDLVTTFHNGGFWNDTTGKRIEAHGGGFIKVGDTWYWIGEDKSHNSGTFRGVNIYASKDLGNWEFRNAIITRDTAPDLLASDRIIERPKIVYNDATEQYVMWLHWEGQNYADRRGGRVHQPHRRRRLHAAQPLPPGEQHVARRHAVQRR